MAETSKWLYTPGNCIWAKIATLPQKITLPAARVDRQIDKSLKWLDWRGGTLIGGIIDSRGMARYVVKIRAWSVGRSVESQISRFVGQLMGDFYIARLIERMRGRLIGGFGKMICGFTERLLVRQIGRSIDIAIVRYVGKWVELYIANSLIRRLIGRGRVGVSACREISRPIDVLVDQQVDRSIRRQVDGLAD